MTKESSKLTFMLEAAEKLRKIVRDVLPALRNISDSEAAASAGLDKWSKKEILGHLIDSAGNNQQKFVRTMSASHVEFVGYQQNFWVASQKYNQERWSELINLWQASNLHLAHIIEHVEPDALANTITIENAGEYTLEFIMKDYAEHLKHHLNQILPAVKLESNFQNIYNT